jgi:tetratricopeptide (TPR) repeat protein
MAAKKWDMAAAVASHLVKVDPQTAGWWTSLAYALRRTESEKAEAILLRAQAIHPKVAMIAFTLACYASVAGRMVEAKEHLRRAIKLDKDVRGLALHDEDLKPCGIGSAVWNSRQGFSSSGLFPLHKEVLNLVEVFETAKVPRAIGRFINQQAAVVSGPHVSGWRS